MIKNIFANKQKAEVREPIVEKKSDEQVISEFLSSKENQQAALSLAHLVKKLCGDGWITPVKVANKLEIKQHEAVQKLEMLCLFNLCAKRWLVDIRQFKITISDESKAEIIKQEIQMLDTRKSILEKKLQSLEKNIKNKNN
jgi:hypothetical protein